jgi:hypothetical protein
MADSSLWVSGARFTLRHMSPAAFPQVVKESGEMEAKLDANEPE